MARTTRVLGFSVPPGVVIEMERVAGEEGRSKSELFREMFRIYQRYRRLRDRDESRWVRELIEEVREEENQRPTPVSELVAESRRLVRYGARRAKRLGIEPQAVDRIIHGFRAG